MAWVQMTLTAHPVEVVAQLSVGYWRRILTLVQQHQLRVRWMRVLVHQARLVALEPAEAHEAVVLPEAAAVKEVVDGGKRLA